MNWVVAHDGSEIDALRWRRSQQTNAVVHSGIHCKAFSNTHCGTLYRTHGRTHGRTHS